MLLLPLGCKIKYYTVARLHVVARLHMVARLQRFARIFCFTSKFQTCYVMEVRVQQVMVCSRDRSVWVSSDSSMQLPCSDGTKQVEGGLVERGAKVCIVGTFRNPVNYPRFLNGPLLALTSRCSQFGVRRTSPARPSGSVECGGVYVC